MFDLVQSGLISLTLAGDAAVIRNQEAKKVRDIGSLIFETPIQNNYEAGVEVRSLLPSEQLEEVDGRLAVLDVDSSSGTRYVRFWVNEIPLTTETGIHEEGRCFSPPVMSQDVNRIPSGRLTLRYNVQHLVQSCRQTGGQTQSMSSTVTLSKAVGKLQGHSGRAMHSTSSKAVDKLPQVALCAAPTLQTNCLVSLRLLLSSTQVLDCCIMHWQSMAHGEFMSCLCLGVLVVAEKAMSCFFGESLFRACCPRKKKQNIQENHTKNKTSMNMSCFFLSRCKLLGSVCRFLKRAGKRT